MNLRRVGCVEYVAGMGKMRYTCKVFVGKPEEKSLLTKLTYGWKDNIRIDFK
jgi:hypothetical protein